MPKTLGPHAGGPGQGIGFWAQGAIVLGPGPIGIQLYDLPSQGRPRVVGTWTWSSIPYYTLPIDTTLEIRAPYFSPPRTAQRLDYNIPSNFLTLFGGGAPFNQDDWPNPLRVVYPVGFTSSFNLNLIGQDKFPPGDINTALSVKPYEYHTQLRTWFWNYNPNLVGQDKVVGKITTDLSPRPYEYHVQLRTWTWNYNLNLIGKDVLPTGELVYDLPFIGPAYPVSLRTFIAIPIIVPPPPETAIPRTPHFSIPRQPLRFSYDIYRSPIVLTAVVVAAPFNQLDWPTPKGPAQPTPSWTWSYNLNLIGQDQLPTGEIVTDRPALSSIQLQTWINTVNLTLTAVVVRPFVQTDWPLPQAAFRAPDLTSWISQTKLLLAVPFKQTDWPVPIGPRPIQSFTASYNLNLIGQDKLPSGEIVTDLPPRAPQQPTPIFVASYNKNLIGQDQLPTGEAITDRPPLAPLSAIQLFTWIQTVNLALNTQAAVLPFNQYSWPINTGPQQPIQVFTASFNKNLIGQDTLPFRQQDWPLATPKPRPLDLVTWIDRAKSYLQKPFYQTDWPVPRPYQQPIQTFVASFNKNLTGQDRLPFRQQDWPLPRDARQPRDYNLPINLALKFPAAARPFAQYSWPLPQQPAPPWQRYSYEFQGGNIYPVYVNPIPPPPDPTPPVPSTTQPIPGLQWQWFDRFREPGNVGWR